MVMRQGNAWICNRASSRAAMSTTLPSGPEIRTSSNAIGMGRPSARSNTAAQPSWPPPIANEPQSEAVARAKAQRATGPRKAAGDATPRASPATRMATTGRQARRPFGLAPVMAPGRSPDA